ncbi:MAG TPA: hypothetical protein VHV31_10055 [Nitrolancea sp.]|jgi:membrane associated rhomboid family serine protease|nr:hypothetical protein [Nitrolancea sp.]
MTLILAFIVPLAVAMLLVRARVATTGEQPRPIAPMTAALFCVVAIPSIAQFEFPGLLSALRRDANEILHHGQVWRLATSLVVQDGGVAGTVFNLMMLLWIAMLATTLLGERNLLLLFIGGAIAGELVGLRWQPIGGGNSVGNLGMAGGLLALAILRGTNLPIRLLAAVGVLLGFVLLFQRNIHGAALLTGIALGFLLLRETKTSMAPAPAVEANHRGG